MIPVIQPPKYNYTNSVGFFLVIPQSRGEHFYSEELIRQERKGKESP